MKETQGCRPPPLCEPLCVFFLHQRDSAPQGLPKGRQAWPGASTCSKSPGIDMAAMIARAQGIDRWFGGRGGGHTAN